MAVPTSHRTAQGSSIEDCEGTDGHHCRLPRGGQLSGGGRDLRHDPEDGAAGDRPHEAGGRRRRGSARGRNYDAVADLVAERVEKTTGRITAKRLLPAARAAGYEGSARNFRRLVAEAKAVWRRGHHRGRRPAVWSPGETWSSTGVCWAGCTCSARCWPGPGSGSCASPPTRGPRRRWRCSRSASRPSAGCPKVVLADRMGCLKGGVVANVVVPTAGLRPVRHPLRVPARFLRGRGPGVEGDRGEPGRLCQARPDGPGSDALRPIMDRRERPRPRRGAPRSTPRSLGDLRGAGRAAGRRAAAARPAAVAATSRSGSSRCSSPAPCWCGCTTGRAAACCWWRSSTPVLMPRSAGCLTTWYRRRIRHDSSSSPA